MNAYALRCPACNGADQSPADAQGMHRCAYCGVRYLPNAATPEVGVGHAVGSPGSKKPGAGLVVAVVLAAIIVLLGLAVGIFVLSGSADPGTTGTTGTTGTPRTGLSPNANAIAAPKPASSARGSVVAAPAAPVIAALTASFEFHGIRSGYETSFYAMGMVTNTSDRAVAKPKIIGVLLDEAGAEVGTYAGFAKRQSLAPGETAAVSILVKDPPTYDRMNFEVVLQESREYLGELVLGLRVVPQPARAPTLGSTWEIAGKVFNETGQEARFVNIEILALSADDKLLAVTSVFADANNSTMPVDSVSRFKTSIVLRDVKPDHFTYIASGRPAVPR